MQKKPIGYQAGKGTILDKKVPKSTKYEHIQSKLAGKTGTTIKDIQFMSNKEISKKNSQLFKRIKSSTLWKMITQENNTESIYDMSKNAQEDTKSQASNLTSITIKTAQLPAGIATDFLLLDLRDPEQYQKYHIKQSINFPGTRIKQDKTTPQLYQYMNKKNKIIIIYHFDQKKGLQYAHNFIQKGYQNIYLLSGGIQTFGQQIQQGLEGKCVPIFQKKDEKKIFKKKRIQ